MLQDRDLEALPNVGGVHLRNVQVDKDKKGQVDTFSSMACYMQPLPIGQEAEKATDGESESVLSTT